MRRRGQQFELDCLHRAIDLAERPDRGVVWE